MKNQQVFTEKKCKAYFYNEAAGTFFVHNIDYHSNYNPTIIRVGITRFPSVNGLMNRVFKRYRKGILEQSILQQAMKVLDYDKEYEIFTIYENNKPS